MSEIAELREKIGSLFKLYSDLKQKNIALDLDNTNLKSKLELKNEEVIELKRHYETLKMAKTITSSSKDAHDAKIKINRIVREIDECISYLNK